MRASLNSLSLVQRLEQQDGLSLISHMDI